MAQNNISAAVAIYIAATALMLMLVVTSAGGAAAASDPIGMPNCVTSCGGVKVPYPFGIGPDASCYLPGFNLTCDNAAGSRPRLLLDADGLIQVLWISDKAEIPLLEVQRKGDVKISVDAHGNGNSTFSRGLRRQGPYTLPSYQNELILTGCNVQATVKNGNVTLASCTSLCKEDEATLEADDDESSMTQLRCSGGTGCCHTDIVTPAGYDGSKGQVYSINFNNTDMSKYDVQLRWLGWNRSADLERFPVRVFIAKKGWYLDHTSISKDLLQIEMDRPMSKEAMAVPVTLRWEVVGHPINSVCKSNHSERIGIKGRRRRGYVCRCSRGYHGNPYLTHGCKDDNECKLPQTYHCYGECYNTEGSFTCQCPPGTTGNHSIPGGCISINTTLPDTGCTRWCGYMFVPYPFGIGANVSCYLPGFNLTCDTRTHHPQLLLGNGQFQVVDISLDDTTVRIMPNSALRAVEVTGVLGRFPSYFDREMPYSLSTSNELVLTGCNAQATLLGHGKPAVISACASLCPRNETVGTAGTIFSDEGWPTDGIHGRNRGGKYCYGMGCCQARISESMDGMPKELRFKWFDNKEFPQIAFIAEEGWFDKPGIASKLMQEGVTSAVVKDVPTVLRWEVMVLRNGSSLRSLNVSWHNHCNKEVAHKLCPSKESHCKPGSRGYTCHCNDGYQGNPYITHGCKGGGYVKRFIGFSILVGVNCGAGILLGVIIGNFISYKFKHETAQFLKRKYFQQNRGQLLQQLVSQRADIAERMIITLEEIEKATNNFDKARELGGGGHGTVYKGILSDLHVVAIKKPKMIIQREIDEFINEVAILSQINHRNVVRLHGCCLETEVPLLVYEFISNGTLYEHLHVEGPNSLSWADRLRIATETAKSLAHLHSTALVPIIHRDVKPANILLDETLTAKVADFGASRHIPFDKTWLTTNVQGTLGYLDPMYMHTWRLTEKSDVYSFGVMLIELMTRKKPFTYMASEGIGLVAHFAFLFAEGNLLEILDPQVITDGGNEIEEIAEIAVACVKLRSEERPTMRQVELRLEATQSPGEVEANGDDAVSSPLASGAELNSRQYSMEEEYILSASYPR